MTTSKATSNGVGCDRQVIPIPADRALVVDAGFLGAKRHIIYGLVEADVTVPRDIRRTKYADVSFTAYLIACLSRAVAANPKVQSYIFGKKYVVYNNVDVATMIEPAGKEGAAAIPHVVRNANHKSVREISDEIRGVKADPDQSPDYSQKLVKLAPKFPRWLRMLGFRMMKNDPDTLRKKIGTVMLTSIGMFGQGGGYGITYMPMHTLGITVGGMQTKPAVINGEIVAHEFVNLTVAFDHDIVDGAPAARFTSAFVKLIESGSVWEEPSSNKEQQDGNKIHDNDKANTMDEEATHGTAEHTV